MEIDIKINEFEGPLDLLLHLIKENKMDVLNLEIGLITEEYLKYIHQMEQLNLDIASSYLVMAADLIEIKSKSLLPKPAIIEIEEEENTQENLVKKLLDYQKYKEISKDFKSLETLRKDVHTKLPSNLNEYANNSAPTRILSLDALTLAFINFLKREEENIPLSTKIASQEYSIEDSRRRLINIFREKKKVSFLSLLEESPKEKDYLVIIFLTILDMAKNNEIIIRQEHNFDDIYCEVIE